MKKCNYLVVFILLSLITQAQDENIDFKFNGFVDTYHAVRSQDSYDFMSSRNRLRTELDINKGNTYLFASLNAIHNSIIEDQTKIELREAFLQYSTENWDLKAGRQIISWGVADGIRITDLVSPLDYTEFLARDYDDIRIPVNAFRLKYIKPSYNIEVVFTPVPEFFILPVDEQNPWSFTSSFSIPYQINLNNKPDKTIDNSEYGIRFSSYLKGVDFSVSYLHTWNKMPVFNYTYSANADSIFVDAYYNKMDMLGLDLSVTVSKFVVRFEIAEYFSETQEIINNGLIEKNTTNFLLGFDWYPGNDWTVMLQYSCKYISAYEKDMQLDEHTAFSTLSISKGLFRSQLKLSTFTYIDIKYENFFSRIYGEYSLTDQIHLLAGYDWFYGDKGMFVYYKDNSEYWIKAKFSF